MLVQFVQGDVLMECLVSVPHSHCAILVNIDSRVSVRRHGNAVTVGTDPFRCSVHQGDDLAGSVVRCAGKLFFTIKLVQVFMRPCDILVRISTTTIELPMSVR